MPREYTSIRAQVRDVVCLGCAHLAKLRPTVSVELAVLALPEHADGPSQADGQQPRPAAFYCNLNRCRPAPWRWTNDGSIDKFQSGRPLVVLSLGGVGAPWALQHSQLASCQSGSITQTLATVAAGSRAATEPWLSQPGRAVAVPLRGSLANFKLVQFLFELKLRLGLGRLRHIR